MAIFVAGVHVNPDIWVAQRASDTGFHMLTARAKVWAIAYGGEPNKPEDFDAFMWASKPIGSQILEDLTETHLNVILDDWETEPND